MDIQSYDAFSRTAFRPGVAGAENPALDAVESVVRSQAERAYSRFNRSDYNLSENQMKRNALEALLAEEETQLYGDKWGHGRAPPGVRRAAAEDGDAARVLARHVTRPRASIPPSSFLTVDVDY